MRALKVLLASAMVAVFAWPGAAFAHDAGEAEGPHAHALKGTSAAQSLQAASTEADLVISTADEFAAFAEQVNSGTHFLGKTVALAADIELAADTPSVGSTSMGSDYIYPIDHAFRGTFDGQGHSILLRGKPLFGMLYGTEKRPATVKNLVLGGKVVSDQSYTGALATFVDGHTVLENVGNAASVTSSYKSSASSGSGAGGLIGCVPSRYNSYYYNKNQKYGSLTMTGCYNQGAVSAASENTGGFIGAFAGGETKLALDRCYSAGDVTSTQKYVSSFVGGLVESDNYRVMSFKNCYASGKLETSVLVDENYDSQFVGVLVGYSYSSMPAKGNIGHVYFGGDLKGGRSYGGLTESAFETAAGTKVKQLNLSNGAATLAKLNATDDEKPDDGNGTPYTAEDGFAFAQDAPDGALPQLYWEADASAAPVAKPQATLPAAVQGLVYTGTPQAGVTPTATDGCGYTLEGWQSTDAGTHTATVTLADGYEWADGATAPQRTVVYSIAKAQLKATYRSETIEATGTPALEVAVTGFKNGETAATAKGYIAPTVARPATAPGNSYTLTPEGGEATNYDFTYAAGTLTVKAVPKPQLTAANTTISVDARGSAVAVYVIRDGALLTAGTHYTLAYRNASGATLASAPTKKGTYTAVVTGKGTYEGTVTQAFTLASDLASAPQGTGTSAGTGTTNQPASDESPVKAGATFEVANATGTYAYVVTDATAGREAATLTKASVKPGKAATIGTATWSGTAFKVTAVGAKAFKSSRAKSVTLGASVASIGKAAFSGAKVKTITVKSKALTKASVKSCLKGSKVTKVKVPKGYAKRYAKLFTKANAGKKAKVK